LEELCVRGRGLERMRGSFKIRVLPRRGSGREAQNGWNLVKDDYL